MGAWNEEPMGNDGALDWIANAIEYPVINAIVAALDSFLKDGSDDRVKEEAEAAVALLLDLTSRTEVKYVRLSFRSMANDKGLWEKATGVISALESNEKWLSQWSHPEKKKAVLKRLIDEIGFAKNAE